MSTSKRTGYNITSGKLFKKNTLALCIMALATPALAQTTATENADGKVEEIIITGARANLQSSQEIKRNSATFVDAISADDIGSLPDKSVTESLQRVPGIALERFAAAADPDHFSIEGSGITLRGLPQTRSEFNGRDSFSANSGRGLSFQDVPPELMAKVEVFKNQSADMIEGGISGAVNLTTRKPFDSANQIIAFTATADYADLSKETEPSFSGLYSNQWNTEAGDFGFLVSVADSKLTTRTDGVREGRLPRATGTTIPIQSDVVVDGQTVKRWVPLNAGINTTIQERERKGASLVGQWRNPTGNFETTFEYLRSDSTQTWTEHAFSQDDNPGTPSADSTYNDVSFTSGTLLDINGLDITTRNNHKTSLVEDYSLHFKYTPTDELTITADVQYVDAKTKGFDATIIGHVKASAKTDFRGDSSVEILPPTDAANPDTYFADPANYFYRAAMDHIEDNDGDEGAYRLDAKYELNDGWAKSVEAGIRFSDREQTTRWSKYNWGVLSEDWSGGRKYFNGTHQGGANYDAPASELFTPDNFYRGNSGIAGGGVLVPSEALVKDYASFLAAVKPFGFVDLASRAGAEGPYVPNEINETKETNKAVYLKLNFGNEDENVLGNIGGRYVEVDNDTVGALTYATPISGNLAPFLPADDITFSDGKQGPRNTVSNSSKKFLPSFGLKYSLRDDVQVRFGVSKAISYPDLGNIRNYTSIYPVLTVVNDANGDTESATVTYNANSGNPHLKPMESVNYDSTVEWYFAKAGSVFAGVFYKDLSNFFANASVPMSFTNNGVTRTVDVDMPINQGNAGLTGFEFGYQQFYDMLPAPFDGLGAQFNITLLDQSGTTPNSGLDNSNPPEGAAGIAPVPIFKVPLQGLSDTTFNLVGMYEKGDISVRFAYNWRSDYLLTTRDVITKLPIYSDSSGQLDASISYKLNDNFKIALEGSNLMDETTSTLMQVDEAGTKLKRNSFINDRRYSLVLKGQF